MSQPQKLAGAIFEEAIALPKEQRAEFLERACGGDAALRRRVEALLRAHEDGGNLHGPARPWGRCPKVEERRAHGQAR